MSKLKSYRPSHAATPEIARPAPDRLIAGDPEFSTWPCGEFGRVSTGVWGATPGTHRVERDGSMLEQFYLLEGEIELTEDGLPPQSFSAGDIVVIEPHFRGIWKTISTVKKVYFSTSL
ncbi:cupin domain-containing protein [Brucella sp. C7-11G]|nr:DUF861 domain-containing protein [Ochrobactrum sp. MT180101]